MEEDYRQLSELQHFIFCRRQWALIHVEQQWAENVRTVEGEIMHHRVHDESKSESRGDILTIRGLRVKSDRLEVVGICDAVEFYRDEEGIELFGRKGRWRPRPVEYKRGKPKSGDEDKAQLCGQAMCLEEMLSCRIEAGDIFYGEPHRRMEVLFTDELRNTVTNALQEMNHCYKRGLTPKVKVTGKCSNCSLRDICLPYIQENRSVESYLKSYLGET